MSVPDHPRNDEAVRRFVEDFASALAEMGVPRMPARVFVALLPSDSGRLAAAAPPPHYYRVPDDVWDELSTIRNRAMARWTAVLREGVPILGADTPAGARIAESVRYFEFVSAELPLVITRWRERRAALHGQASRDP